MHSNSQYLLKKNFYNWGRVIFASPENASLLSLEMASFKDLKTISIKMLCFLVFEVFMKTLLEKLNYFYSPCYF